MMMMTEAMILENIELELKLLPTLKAKVKEKNPAKKSKSSPKRSNLHPYSFINKQIIISFLLI